MKRLADIANNKNKYFKVFKGYIMKNGEQMDFAVDGEMVYPEEDKAIIACLAEELSKNEMLIERKADPSEIRFKPISEIILDDTFTVQVIAMKVLSEELDFENIVLNDDDSFYFRAADHLKKTFELNEYKVTKVDAYKDDDGKVNINSADIQLNEELVKGETF